MRGWGPLLTRVVREWYLTKDVQPLCYQMVKYQSRDGWSHRDMLRLSHPRPLAGNHSQSTLFKWAAGKTKAEDITRDDSGLNAVDNPLALLYATEKAKTADEAETVRLIEAYNLPRECVKTEHLKSSKVWEALLQRMPLNALIRNLGNMTALGLIAPNSAGTIKAVTALSNRDKLRKARVHPLAVYLAMATYNQGHGMKGANNWKPVTAISDALEDAFYASFDYVETTGKRWFLGLDVSGSMGGAMNNMPLSYRDATALLAMVTLRTEPFCFVGGFQNTLTPLPLTSKQKLETAVKHISNLSFGSTDCAQPMIYALDHKIDVDCFVIYTDNETCVGDIHPKQALDKYRQKTGIAARSVVVCMAANKFSIADPKDAGMMDVVGFDTTVPTVLADFASGGKGSQPPEAEE